MTEGDLGEHTATRGTLHKPLLDQIGLDDLLDDVALIAERGCHRFNPDRATPIVFGDAAQIAPIHTVEATPIDFEPQQRRISSARIDARQTLDRGKVAYASHESHRYARGAARAAGDLGSAVGAQVETEQPRGATDDRLELGRFVEDEPKGYAEALAQRSSNQPRSRRRADQGEGRDIDADRTRRRTLADDQVELKILHRGIEDLLDRRRQTVDLVDEKDVARLQVGQQCGKVATALDHRARAGAEAHPHLASDDLSERCLAEPWRSREQHMVQGFAPAPRGFDEDSKIVTQLALADKLGERLRS